MKQKDLELFRDVATNLSTLTNDGAIDLFLVEPTEEVQVNKDHFINILIKFKNKEVSEQDLLEWVYVIRFTDLFEIDELYAESILLVMDKIQFKNLGWWVGNHTESDIMGIINGKEKMNLGPRIPDVEIDNYINAVNKNIEL